MVADFRRRFWISLALTAPVLVLSPLIQCRRHNNEKIMTKKVGFMLTDPGGVWYIVLVTVGQGV